MERLSRNEVKRFSALSRRKRREEEGLFIAEGRKLVQEALNSGWRIECLICEEGTVPELHIPENVPVKEAAKGDFSRISDMVQSEGMLAVVHTPAPPAGPPRGPAFLLDGIQDPGNLGALLRIAEWYGMPSVVLGTGTADPFNAKSVRGSMGSVFRLELHVQTDLEAFLQAHGAATWIADMDGESAETAPLSERPFILMGNEGQGVSPALRAAPGVRLLTLRRYGQAESLNVATAAAVLAFAWRQDAERKGRTAD